MKRVFLAALCFMAGTALSAETAGPDQRKSPSLPPEQTFSLTGVQVSQRVNLMLDSLYDACEATEVRFFDTRVAPVIRSELCYEVPIEIGVSCTEEKLVPFLQKIQRFSFDEMKFWMKSLSVSCSAEKAASGKPLLTVTLFSAVIFGVQRPDEAVKTGNEALIAGLNGLFKHTGFTPQVAKRGEAFPLPEKNREGAGTWLTNLRIDGEFRAQLTGYSIDFKLVTRLGNDLAKAGNFSETFITSMNKNVYEKVSVFRFDLCGRVGK